MLLCCSVITDGRVDDTFTTGAGGGNLADAGDAGLPCGVCRVPHGETCPEL